MKTTLALTLAAVLSLGVSVTSTTSAQDAGKVDFEKQVLPILKESCFKCHEKEHEDNGKMKKPKGGLRLDGAAVITKGGKENPGETIVAGKPDASWLVKTIVLPESDDLAMPPEGKGDRVSAANIALIKKWISEGASFGAWKGVE
ncbi:MAG: hypothetical protein JWR15_1235 [Prosthecobacter sp.]|nr:hypothetical protein [Prosthecobacter sp.]